MLCLPETITSKFLDAIKSGELDVVKLAGMTDSAERSAEFGKVLGKEYAESANTLFENKLMLKDQQAGLIDFIKTLGGLKPEVRSDYLNKIKGMERLLSPSETESFLADATKQHLGLAVSESQAKTIYDLAKAVDAESPDNKSAIKNLQDLVIAADKLTNLTPEQKDDIDSIKSQLQDIQDAKDKITAERQAQRDAILKEKEDARQKTQTEKAQAREKVRVEKQVEKEMRQEEKAQAKLDAREKKMSDYLEQKAERDLEKKQFREQQKTERINQRIEDNEERARQKELDDYDKETARLQKKAEAKLTKDTVGKMAKTLKDSFGENIPDDVQQKIDNLKQIFEEGKGDRTAGVSAEFINAKSSFDDYVKNLKPISATESIANSLATIARSNLLANPATPIKTFESGAITNGIEFMLRRLSNLSLQSDNYAVAKELNEDAAKFTRETGKNQFMMESYDDTGQLGSKRSEKQLKIISKMGRGDTMKGENFNDEKGDVQAGNKIVRAAEKGLRIGADFYNKVIIEYGHQKAFNAIYRKAWVDSINFIATDMAKSEGLTGEARRARGEEIMRDAGQIVPETDAGKIAKAAAQNQTARILGANDTWGSKVSLSLKNGLNGMIPHLGDALIPIAKIPANIIANGLDNAGVGAPKAMYDMWKGMQSLKSDDVNTKYEGAIQFKNGVQHLMRIGGTLAVAAYLTSQIPANTNYFRSDAYGNHYVKIGGVWVSLEYVSFISPALAGMMYAKAGKKGGFIAGAASSLKNLPGVTVIGDAINSISLGNEFKDIIPQIASRTVPAFLSNFGKDRPINRMFFGASGVETEQEYQEDTKAANAKAKATRAANKKLKGPTLKAPVL